MTSENKEVAVMEECRKVIKEEMMDIPSHPEYGKYTVEQWIRFFLYAYQEEVQGDCDGWLLDQIARISFGGVISGKMETYQGGCQECNFTAGTSPAYEFWVTERKRLKDIYKQGAIEDAKLGYPLQPTRKTYN